MAAVPSALRAQSLPSLTIEAAAGAGHHTNQSGAVWYYDDALPITRVAIGYRIAQWTHLGAYAKAEYTGDLAGDQLAICKIAPNGSCYEHFESNLGIAASLGLRRALGSRASLGAALGLGNYSDHLRGYGEAEATFAGGSHVAALVTARYMRWSSAGQALWYAPITLGVQLF